MDTEIEQTIPNLHSSKLAHLPAEDIRPLEDIKRAILKTIGERNHRILLFRSKARGDYGHTSDLDVAVIVDRLDSTLKNANL